MGWNVFEPQSRFNDIKLHIFHGPVHQFDRLAGPAKRAKGSSNFVSRLQAPHVHQKTCHPGQHTIIQGCTAKNNRFGIEYVCHDVAAVTMSQVDEFDADSCRVNTGSDGLGHFLGGFPHGIIDDQGLSLALVLAPVSIGLEDIIDMGAPDNTMIRGNHIYLESHFLHLGQEFPN